MKYLWGGVLLVPMAVLAAGIILQMRQDKLTDVPLTFRAVHISSMADSPYMFGVAAFGYVSRDEKETEAYGLPHLQSKPRLIQIHMGAREMPLAGLLSRATAADGRYDQLRLDWNNDKNFTDEKVLNGKLQGDRMVFGPVDGTFSDGLKVASMLLLVEKDIYCYGIPAGYREGKITLGGRQHRVAAVDTNLDGQYQQGANGAYSEDVLLLDYDGDGQFGSVDESSGMLGALEHIPMGSLAQLPDGKLYKVTLGGGGSKISFEPDTSPKAYVKAPGSRLLVCLQGEEKAFTACCEKGVMALPAGEYELAWAEVGLATKTGERWTATLMPSREDVLLKLAPGETMQLDCGPPFKLTLAVQEYNRAYSIGVQLEDKAGNSVVNLRMPNGERPKEPELKILDASGKEIKAQSFHYG
jgi:hypothetical protein